MQRHEFGKRKDGRPYPKRTKKEIKGLVKKNISKLSTKAIGTTKNLKVIKGERNAIHKDSKGNLLVIDPRDNRLGVVNLAGEYQDKDAVLQFIKKHERQLKGKVMIKKGEIKVMRRLATIKDATANKVIREEHLLMLKKIPQSQIHQMLTERHGATAGEILEEEHRMLKEGIPEGKVHLALRKIYG